MSGWRTASRALAFGLCLAATLSAPCRGRAEDDAESLLGLGKSSRWDNTFDLKTWSGYKDNVLFGHERRLESPFIAGGIDTLFWRQPGNGWEFLILGSGEYLRYLPGATVEKEATGLFQAQAKKSFGDGWKAGLSSEYIYFNQVFDNSQFDNTFHALPVEGHTLTLRPSLRREMAGGFFAELEPSLARQFFREVVDEEWQGAMKISLGRSYGRNSELSAGYLFSDRQFDTRQPRDAGQQFVAGKSLEFFQNEIFGQWRQTWDAGRHWRTATKWSFQRNNDNGSGYYDYYRPRFSQQIRYTAKTWQIRAEAKLTWYLYDIQPIGAADSPLRHKTLLQAGLRAEKTLFKSVKVFGEYEHEHAISNLAIDDYRANTLFGGFGWEF
jgi:hypothetical protein